MAENIYTDSQVNKLEKYENILDNMVDVLSADYNKNKDNRTARLLLETITTSTESIHKGASNKIKSEANKANEGAVALVTQLLAEMSDNSKNPHRKIRTDDDLEELTILIVVPNDIVKGEGEIGQGWLSLEDLSKGKENE